MWTQFFNQPCHSYSNMLTSICWHLMDTNLILKQNLWKYETWKYTNVSNGQSRTILKNYALIQSHHNFATPQIWHYPPEQQLPNKSHTVTIETNGTVYTNIHALLDLVVLSNLCDKECIDMTYSRSNHLFMQGYSWDWYKTAFKDWLPTHIWQIEKSILRAHQEGYSCKC